MTEISSAQNNTLATNIEALRRNWYTNLQLTQSLNWFCITKKLIFSTAGDKEFSPTGLQEAVRLKRRKTK
jgi:hypothetical protein